ncbi:hypothetical protein LZ30DRAFT_729870 [Colletotrichum cereale]|nr:hypothetical protein LZ30DRAFT_729870 [Colletotrichum cereale]
MQIAAEMVLCQKKRKTGPSFVQVASITPKQACFWTRHEIRRSRQPFPPVLVQSVSRLGNHTLWLVEMVRSTYLGN